MKMSKEERRARYLSGALGKAKEVKNIVTQLVMENISLRKRNKFLEYKNRQKDRQILDLSTILKASVKVEDKQD